MTDAASAGWSPWATLLARQWWQEPGRAPSKA